MDYRLQKLKMRTQILFLLVFISHSLFSQKMDESLLEEIEMFESILYTSKSSSFRQTILINQVNEGFVFPWNDKAKYSDKQLTNSLDSLNKNSILKLEQDEFLGNRLIYNSYFPRYIESELLDIFKIVITEVEIFNSSGEKVNVGRRNSIFYGNKFSSGSKDGNAFSYNWKTVNVSISIEKQETIGDLYGSTVFEAKFVSGYDYKKIDKSDIGSIIKLGNYNYKIVDIIHNNILLSTDGDFKEAYDIIKAVSINNMGDKIEAISISEFKKMKDNDDNITEDNRVTKRKSTITNFDYLVFKEIPYISYDEYKSLIHDKMIKIVTSGNSDKIRDEEFGEKYILIETVSEINSLYLYVPKFGIKSEFEVKLK